MDLPVALALLVGDLAEGCGVNVLDPVDEGPLSSSSIIVSCLSLVGGSIASVICSKVPIA